MDLEIYERLSERQRTAIDELFINGFNRPAAYRKAYPNVQEKNARASMYILMKKSYVQLYYAERMKEFANTIKLDKMQMITGILNQIETYESMVELSLKDDITEKERDKVNRYKWLVNGADIAKYRDMLCKLIGAYEPEKIEIQEKTFKIGFTDVDIIE